MSDCRCNNSELGWIHAGIALLALILAIVGKAAWMWLVWKLPLW